MSRKISDHEIAARRVFGRRLGRPLSKCKKNLLENLLPVLSILESALAQNGSLDPATLYPRPLNRFEMEIGFGSGEHLAALLRAHPDTGFLAAEPYINGMGAFLKSIAADKPENVRVLMDDAMKIVHALKDECLEKIYILNPDPWPKKRHHKRRIVSRENLTAFARVLKPGGLLVMATDVDALAEWMVTESVNHPAFAWTARSAADWQSPPPGWIRTRYAAKGETKGHRQTFLVFQRL